jgi:hypothetical protein
MFKCPACKDYTITWKQKFIASQGKKITCSNCGSIIKERITWWAALIMVTLIVFIGELGQYLLHDHFTSIIRYILMIPIMYFIASIFLTFVTPLSETRILEVNKDIKNKNTI